MVGDSKGNTTVQKRRTGRAPSIAAALDYLKARDWATAPRIVICGSLYLAGEALALDGRAPT